MSGSVAMTTVRIVPASPDDAGTLAVLIAEAFGHLDIGCWLVGDPVERRRILPGSFRLLVDHALIRGTVHTTAERIAGAVWLPATPIPDIDNYDAPPRSNLRRAHLPVPRPRRGQARHPPEYAAARAPGVPCRPPKQHGAGLGRALLARQHHLLDAQGIPAYLDASSERSRELYLRHGYQRLGEPLRLLPDGPPMWPMWRQPPSPWQTPSCARTQPPLRPARTIPLAESTGPDRAGGQEVVATDPAA